MKSVNRELSWLENDAYDEWNAFVSSCENGTVFHLSHLLEPLASFFNCNFRILVKRNAENRITAGFPLLEKKKFGSIKLTYFPPTVRFYGIIHEDKASKYSNKRSRYQHKIYDEFIAFLEKNYSYAKLTFPINVKDIRPFIWKNFTPAVNYTFCSGIDSPAELFNGFDPAIKRRIKSAEKEPYEFKCGVNQQQINNIYNLQEQSFQRQGLQFKLNRAQFTRYIQLLNEHELVNIYTVLVEEKPVSSVLALMFKETAYYWMAGTDSSIASTGFNQLNFWLMILDLHETGIRNLDFAGASTPSIANYKSNYNFELQSYYMAERSFRRTTALLMQMKRLIS